MWAGVREQVLALREVPRAAKVFGARGHGFEVEPTLSEAEVAAAEGELGVTFPADYRSFLVEVGAGGAGPHYGLFPLRRDAQGWHWAEDGRRREGGALLVQPFPSVDDRARWAQELDAREPTEGDYPDDASYRAAFRTWDDEWERLHQRMTAGAICLAHEGCGYYTWLVVTGPDRGTLWTDLRAADGPVEPLTDGARPLEFGVWYRNWLSRASREARARG